MPTQQPTGSPRPKRTRRKIRFPFLLAAVILLPDAVLGLPATAANEPTEVHGFGPNPGNLRMWVYLPRELPPAPPLVVALHGCRQQAADYDHETGWVQYADAFKFALLLPEQKIGWWLGNNPAGCFNWFYRGDQARGRGEVLSIKQMIDKAIADYAVDAQRVYVTGLSAGAAMTAVMIAAYPESFAGGAIIAGIPYGCSRVPSYVPHVSMSMMSHWLFYTDPFVCMNPGLDLTASNWGDRVRAATGRVPRRWPIVSVWQGDTDTTVARANAIELIEQWTDVHGTDAVPDLEDTVNSHPHRVYHDTDGTAVAELYLIRGAGHGTPIDPVSDHPGTEASDRCGTRADYMLPVGICASYYIARFWGLIP